MGKCVKICQTAQPVAYAVEILAHTDFIDAKELAKKLITNRNKCDNGPVYWLTIRAICVEKAHPNIVFLKTDFGDTQYTAMKQRKKQCKTLKLKPAYTQMLPISQAKYRDLMSMVKAKIIPSEYGEYCRSLPFSRQQLV